MTLDLETWLIDAGDVIVNKKTSQGADSLTEAERAVEWMWRIDYSVRNSGSFGPLEDMDSTSVSDLKSAANGAQLIKLAAWLDEATDEEAFCRNYQERFDEACMELKDWYDRSAQARMGS